MNIVGTLTADVLIDPDKNGLESPPSDFDVYQRLLPDELLIEVGTFATDWAVIEQELRHHLISVLLFERPTREQTPSNFSQLRKDWFKACNRVLPAHFHQTATELNDRLVRRSDARNYALHGNWLVSGSGQLRVVIVSDRKLGLTRETISTSLEEVREQTASLRRMRLDIVTFIAETCDWLNGEAKRRGLPMPGCPTRSAAQSKDRID